MKRPLTLLLAALALVTTTSAAAQDLEELLTQVGERYAEAYASPFLYAFGPNTNANLYSTAAIPWNRVTFGFGIKAMGTYLDESDQSFRTVIHDQDLHDYFPNDFAPGQVTGDIVMTGPTMFGDTNIDGTIKGYASGVEVASYGAIPGLIDTRWVPMATPEIYLGGLYGVKATVRWVPEIDAGDYGKTKYFGWGLQWNLNGALETELPVDVMFGFFDQSLKVGSLIDSSGTSYHVAVSRTYPVATVYGGFAKESSSMDITYTYFEDFGDQDPTNDIEQDIAIRTDGRQEHRWTLGVTLNVLMNLNLEMGHGDLTTYSAGLMFGF